MEALRLSALICQQWRLSSASLSGNFESSQAARRAPRSTVLLPRPKVVVVVELRWTADLKIRSIPFPTAIRACRNVFIHAQCRWTRNSVFVQRHHTIAEELFVIVFTYLFTKLNQRIKCSAVRRRKGLGEFGIALLHVIEVGYNTLHRCPAENTKRFWLASLSRSSNLRIKV